MQEISPSFADASPIVIRKRAPRRPERRHGAWKVAFADFVTAMMALFMVMWLMAANDDTRRAVAGYFNDPKGFSESHGNGGASGTGAFTLGQHALEGIARSIESAMVEMPNVDQSLLAHVEMSVGDEGLKIELLENEEGLFFQSGSATPSVMGREAIELIGRQLAVMPHSIVIEGHTDAEPFRGRQSYGNWELSADRANAARRILTESGVAADRIAEVRGFAAMKLRIPRAPRDASNRRVSLIVRYD